MYVRFVIPKQDLESHSLLGVFQAVFELREAGMLLPHEEQWLDAEIDWLNEHLKEPDCLGEPGTHRAISWFRSCATDPIEKVRSIVALLREKGLPVEMIKADNPGTILYEDDWQVVAIPPRKKPRNNQSGRT